ncbi:TUG ubiquitin-like domain-containing protein [Hirsutella rhossiliensis]|uniref:TUG ubiquitin-like domain-containing protein n=1 Tax=Hirsutella rhossiliensis TaxID=111463 RepID=A0A9P8SCA5_9HYPO|nr:TUG ubiquitin-like domain-containing protein [Hirsutella rhossiliensis]KAH0957346.1 TUG ubiquitin-like domain-containing protein [Hirsutella rhossiliensis]
MSSHVVVIATDLRRTTIKVSPGTYLIDVLQEACKKLNLTSDKYLLRHKQKQVDLSVPLRASGLLPGAKLELVQKSNTPSAVQIALQIPQPEAKEIPGGRLIRKFPSDLTLWKVLRQFESGEASGGRNVNITARGVAGGLEDGRGSGQLYYETPVLNIMGRELSTFADFQKTLSQLGHNSGNVLIRLSYRTTQQTLFEAMEQISQFFKEAGGEHDKVDDSTPDSKPKDETAAQSQDTAMADAAPAPPNTSPEARKPPAQQPPTVAVTQQSHQEAVSSDEPTTSRDPYQPVNVFLAPTGSTPAAALAPADEEDFAPTAAHAQLHQARLLESSRNKRLPSDKELEDKAAAEAARIAAIKSVLVKVRFPDNTSSEWQIGPQETGAFLYEAVRQVMASRSHAFRLVLPGGKTAIQDDGGPRHSIIKGYKFSGRVLVNLVWDDDVPLEARQQPFLKANVAQRGQAVRIPELPSTQDDGEPAPSLQPQPPRVDRGEGKGDGGGKKMPKWFKLGKK